MGLAHCPSMERMINNGPEQGFSVDGMHSEGLQPVILCDGGIHLFPQSGRFRGLIHHELAGLELLPRRLQRERRLNLEVFRLLRRQRSLTSFLRVASIRRQRNEQVRSEGCTRPPQTRCHAKRQKLCVSGGSVGTYFKSAEHIRLRRPRRAPARLYAIENHSRNATGGGGLRTSCAPRRLSSSSSSRSLALASSAAAAAADVFSL